ncbi:MAG: glycosyltransferase family 39 protein [Pseudomonadota bacterium]
MIQEPQNSLTSPEKKTSIKLEMVVLIIIWGLFSTAHLLWLWKNQRPLYWDQSHHFLLALDCLEAFSDPRTWVKIFSLDAKYPPLFHLSLAGLFWFVGPTIRFAASINLFWVLATMIPIWLLGRKIYGPWAGIVAATTFILSPIGAGLPREVLIEVCLTALVAWTVWLLSETQGLSRRRPVVFLGVLFGLGLLAKWIYLPLVAGPFLWALTQADPKRNPIDWKGLKWALIFCLAIALPWYLHTPRTLIKVLFYSGWTYGAEQAYPKVFSLAGWLRYPELLINNQLFLGTSLFVFLGIGWNLLKNRRQAAFLLAWFFPGLLFITFLRTKDTRFLFPLLPATLLLGVGWVFSLTSQRARKPAQVLILLFPLWAFLGTSLRLPVLSEEIDLRLGSALFRLSGPTAGYAWPPDPADWSIPLIFKTLLQDRSNPGSPVRLAVLSDLPAFHKDAFKVWGRAHGLPITVQSVLDTKKWTPGGERESLIAEIAQLDYLLTKTGDLGPGDFFKAQELLDLDSLEREGRISPMSRFSLPDGTLATLWRITMTGADRTIK